MNLYEILKKQYKTNTNIGKNFPKRGKPRSSQAVGKWKFRGVPEDVAILCHINPEIPYEHPTLTGSEHAAQ